MLGICKALHLQSHTETKQNPSWNNEHLIPVLKNNNIMQKKTRILNLWFKECLQTQCAYITNLRPRNWKLSLPPRSQQVHFLLIQMFISISINISINHWYDYWQTFLLLLFLLLMSIEPRPYTLIIHRLYPCATLSDRMYVLYECS